MGPTEGTKKIGIRFGDNDFYYTISAFLSVLLPDDEHTHHMATHLTFTKAQIVELFNNMAPSLYTLKQNAWRYQPTNPKYLRITEDKVYLDDEVDAFVKAHPEGDNGEFFAVDFTKAYIWKIWGVTNALSMGWR